MNNMKENHMIISINTKRIQQPFMIKTCEVYIEKNVLNLTGSEQLALYLLEVSLGSYKII